MKKINNKKVLNIATILVLIITPFIKFFSMNLESFGIINNYDCISPVIVLYEVIPFLIYIYISDIVRTKRKLDIFDYIFYLLVISGIITVLFSIDKNIAIYGKDFRHEGFLSLLSYYLLFINHKVNGDKESIKRILNIFLFIGIINSIYAILQIYTNFKFVLRYSEEEYMAAGMCGNPNFFGSLIVTCLGIITCKILIKDKIRIIDILITILFFVSLINAQSTGPFLTFIFTLVFLIIFLKIKKQLILKSVVVLIILFISTYISVYCINKYIYKIEKCEMCKNEFQETINSGGRGRLIIWKNSIKIVKDNFLTGVGFDNFYLVYPNPKINNIIIMYITNDSLTEERKTYYIVDNAHNEYLNRFVSTGIIGLIPYLVLLLLTFYRGICSKNKLMYILFGGFVAYSIQAFTNISVIQIAPIYYIIIGLILSNAE